MEKIHDPQYPRPLKRDQADREFSNKLIELTVLGIEGIVNSRVTVYECPACGTVTYGDPLECGKCHKRRGMK